MAIEPHLVQEVDLRNMNIVFITLNDEKPNDLIMGWIEDMPDSLENLKVYNPIQCRWHIDEVSKEKILVANPPVAGMPECQMFYQADRMTSFMGVSKTGQVYIGFWKQFSTMSPSYRATYASPSIPVGGTR